MSWSMFDELPNSPRGNWTRDGRYEIVREGIVSGDDLVQFELFVLPRSEIVGGELLFYPGAQLPFNSLFYASGFSWQPHFGSESLTSDADVDGVLQHDQFRVTVTFGTLQVPDQQQNESFDPVVLLEHSFESGGEFLTLPNVGLRWDGETDQVSGDVEYGLFIPTTQHSVKWPRILNPNWTALENFKGHVNATAFTLRGFPYPAETLVYAGYGGGQEIVFGEVPGVSARAFNLTLKFESKMVPLAGGQFGGWNHHWREDSGAFERIESFQGGEPLYQLANFNQFFVAD